jgi:hypothetical protein
MTRRRDESLMTREELINAIMLSEFDEYNLIEALDMSAEDVANILIRKKDIPENKQEKRRA